MSRHARGFTRPDAPVPFAALDREHAQLRDDLHAALAVVLRESGFVLGGAVERFEEQWAAACETAHCVGTSSGTAALATLLRALGIGAGDEVIVPAHTYIASALAVVHAGATPVLVDVDDGTGLIDMDAAAAAIGPRTAAVMPVHLYGQLCDMPALQRLAARHGIALVEDAAQAHGATWDGRPAGGFGAGAAFSFYPSKNLGALGDAGALCTNDERVAERARQLRNMGQRRKGEHIVVGYNDRLDGLQAAFLSAKLARLDSGNAIRRMHARTYREVLDGSVALLHERPAAPCVYHLFPVRIAGRRAVAETLRRAGVGTGVHYSPAVHRHPALAGLTVLPEPPRRSEAWAGSELSLPMSPALTRYEIHRAADACASAVAEAAESGAAAERKLEHV